MTDIQPFTHEQFGTIRTITDASGEAWFVATDICAALDLSNTTVALQRLDADERSKFNLGRQGDAWCVNEAGFYSLVLASRKPEAKSFKRWVTHEVLPSIRKHGGYLTPEKADMYDRFLGADGTYSIGNVAKMVGLSQNKLFDRLRNSGVLIAKGAMRNTPYQRYMHHFSVHPYDFERSDGTRGTSYTTRVQPSGIQFICRKLNCHLITEEAA